MTRFVSFTRAGKTEFYQVKYEKLPTFCRACGKLGHLYQECGAGEFDEDQIEWGPFILAPRRGRGANRGANQGRDNGRGRTNSQYEGFGPRGEEEVLAEVKGSGDPRQMMMDLIRVMNPYINNT